MRVLALSLLVLAGCNRDPMQSGFMNGPTGPVELTVSSTSTGSTGFESTGSTTSMGSTGSAAGSSDGGVPPDLGTPPDFGSHQPVGCKGKIDFLFAISRLNNMVDQQAALLASFDGFIAAIEEDFADFDAHIIVANPDGAWTGNFCEDYRCPDYYPNCGPNAEAYVCDGYPGMLTNCDSQIGAGLLFNAGAYATNYKCELAGGRRYIVVKEEPDLSAQFKCIASVGINGPDTPMMKGIAAALDPKINGDGGCNEGFLRPDALLVIVMVMDTVDGKSWGTPTQWANEVFATKGGDPDAVVMVAVIPPFPDPNEPLDPLCGYDSEPPLTNNLRLYAEKFPHRVYGSTCDDTYVPAFAEAATVIKETCGAFIPQ